MQIIETTKRPRFNSQPPEGGWEDMIQGAVQGNKFQLTAARRRLDSLHKLSIRCIVVSTHSRPKAAVLHDLITSPYV